MSMYGFTADPALRGQARVLDPYKWGLRWVGVPTWVLNIKPKAPERTAMLLDSLNA